MMSTNREGALVRFRLAAALSATAITVAGCTDKYDDLGETSPVVSIEVEPADMEIEVSPGTPGSVEYTAYITREDGTEFETTNVEWESSNLTVGSIDSGGVFVSGDDTGGKTNVRASYLGRMGQTSLTVVYVREVQEQDVPADAPQLFEGIDPVEDPDAPVLLYPLDGVKMPRNTPRIHFMWEGGTVCNLFRLRFRSEVTQVDVYTTDVSWIPDDAVWHTIAAANAGGTTTLELSGLAFHDEAGTSVADTEPLVAGEPITIDISRLDAGGSIYYWTTSFEGAVYRIPFGSSDAQEFYGMGNYGHCVSCHVISPDGTRMAVTYDGGNENMGLVSMEAPLDDGQAIIPYDAEERGNFKTFSPDGDRMLTSYWGTLTMWDAHTGQALYDLDLDEAAAMPSWSPTGEYIAVVLIDQDSWDPAWVASFNGGRIALLAVDAAGTVDTNPHVIVEPEGDETVYYPAFSPDGQWIAYNRSHDTAGDYYSWNTYDDPSARLFVVNVDGTVGHELLAANGVGHLTNSWPGWAPLSDADVLWLTFSTKRAYGFYNTDESRPQIWVTAFDLGIATSSGGGDPSSPPFWLPFQDTETSNHIPAWGPE